MRARALAVALLLLLSTLGGMGVASSLGANIASVAGHALDCAAHDEDGGRPPLAHCALCCILCDGAGQLGVARAVSAAPAPHLASASAAPRASLSMERAGGLDRHPPGWASSWSSQAPPRFS
jgi:hypothetical protein